MDEIKLMTMCHIVNSSRSIPHIYLDVGKVKVSDLELKEPSGDPIPKVVLDDLRKRMMEYEEHKLFGGKDG